LLARWPEALPPGVLTRYGALVERRERREPLQHLTGSQEFYGLELAVDRRALIPRPETEGLVDAVLGETLPHEARVLDIGTGSGCIAIALAVARADLVLVAVDRSAQALELARENASRHGVGHRIEFQRLGVEDLPGPWPGGFDAVVSNPPYVSEAEWGGLEPEVREYEPREALVAGASGLEAYRCLAPVSLGLLRPDGRLVVELGYGQAEAVRQIVASAGLLVIRLLRDLRGIDRVLVARRPEAHGPDP
jgi:release factor glutamine methyltransferase